jgi:hypothetical protein
LKIRSDDKVTIISDTSTEVSGGNIDGARIKFFGLFISALCKVQSVCFEKRPAVLTPMLKLLEYYRMSDGVTRKKILNAIYEKSRVKLQNMLIEAKK